MRQIEQTITVVGVVSFGIAWFLGSIGWWPLAVPFVLLAIAFIVD